MPRKRHSGITPYEALLGRLIHTLEVTAAPLDANDTSQIDAGVRAIETCIRDVLDHGPLHCQDKEHAAPVDAVEVRAELLQLLRSAIKHERTMQPSTGIGLDGWVEFSATAAAGWVGLSVRAKHTRDLVVLQTIHLLQLVGLRNVRECSATDCQRLYVKAYRREFCSERCQKRINTRKQRANEREKRARTVERRRRRRTERGA